MSAAPREAPPPIPVTVVTGFLGAGKTTLLNRLLKTPAFSDTVVLVNEFGEIALDHLLIEPIEGDIVSLPGGCLCCLVQDDLLAVMEDLIRRRDNGRITPFRRIVIETTGVADPVPILQAAARHPYLAMRYTIDGVVTVVDASRAPALLQGEAEAQRQVLFADRVILSKTGELSAEALEAARRAVRAVNAGAPLIDGRTVEASELLDIAPREGVDAAVRAARWLGAEAAPVHDGDIRSAALFRDAPLPHGALPLFTELLASAHGSRILRLKGLLALADDPARPVVIHGVQHVFERPRRLEAWPDDDHRSRIVVIARDLDPELLAKVYDAFAGVPAVDAPDRAALIDNPLVPGSGGFIR